jgi:hypothetical protein
MFFFKRFCYTESTGKNKKFYISGSNCHFLLWTNLPSGMSLICDSHFRPQSICFWIIFGSSNFLRPSVTGLLGSYINLLVISGPKFCNFFSGAFAYRLI